MGILWEIRTLPVLKGVTFRVEPESAGMEPESADMEPESAGMEPESAGFRYNRVKSVACFRGMKRVSVVESGLNERLCVLDIPETRVREQDRFRLLDRY